MSSSKVFKGFTLVIVSIALLFAYGSAQSDSMMDNSMMEDSMMASDSTVMFQVFILNSSTAETLNTSTGRVPVPLAPGVWVVHQTTDPLFTAGQADRGEGLEALAEDGNPATLGTLLATKFGSNSGVFNTPLGANQPGPALPEDIYHFTFNARPGDYLSFATMFVQSNDLFYAPSGQGIALFDHNGNPTAGNISDQVFLWDAGTEVDEEPGNGPNQAPHQSGPNVGSDENGLVVLEEPHPSTNNRIISVIIMPVS